MKKPTLVLTAVTVLALAGCADSSEGDSQAITVFAAASLQPAFDDIIEQFHHAHEGALTVETVYDGSSTLITQLAEGASVDVLATANEDTMDQAHADDLLVEDPEVFATNELVMATREDAPTVPDSLAQVSEFSYAICAAEVPCGQATVELFDQNDLSLAPISEETSVTAVANRITEGEVEVGFIYTTDVAARPELQAVPIDGQPVINTYPIAPTSQSPAAKEFVDFVLANAGQEILAEHGFGSK